MSNITLFQLSSEYQRLAEFLAAAELDEQTVADTLEGSGLPDAIADKAHAIEMIARTIEQHQPAIAAEIDRLQKLEAHRWRAAKALRDYLLKHMLACGISKIETPLFSLRVADNPPAVEVFDAGMVPAQFIRQPEPPPPQIDKRALAAAMRAGEVIPGAKLVRAQRLVVR